MLRKLMAEYVWDLVHLEGNPFTFVNVQALLSGTTVRAHRQSDAQQVLNHVRSSRRSSTASAEHFISFSSTETSERRAP